MREVIILAVFFAAAAIFYKFRARILIALRQFDARNAARRFEEFRDRHDRFAHYKHTLRLAEEQVEGVTSLAVADERTGMPVTRYLFLGTQYATRNEAEAARRAVVTAKAREFYIELDKIWLGRRAPWHDVREPGPTLPPPSETKH
jgi:hypothetical protein